MNRRDFLLLRTDRGRAVELSCRRLYLWYLDTQITHGPSSHVSDVYEDPGPWDGEPAAVLEMRTFEQLFRDLEHDLLDVKTLRVCDREWLIHEEMSRELEALLAAFRLRGGLVEFPD